MAYLIVFLINLLVLNFWLWLFQSMFRRKQNKRLIFVIIVAMGLLSTGAMLLYPQIAHLIDL